MAIDRPRGGRPAPEGSQRSGERQASGYFGARGMTEAKPQSGENSCGTPLRRRPRSAAPNPRPDQPITGRQDGLSRRTDTRKRARGVPPAPLTGPADAREAEHPPHDLASAGGARHPRGQLPPPRPTWAMQPGGHGIHRRPGTRSSRHRGPPRPRPPRTSTSDGPGKTRTTPAPARAGREANDRRTTRGPADSVSAP
jgi:hypothetical protein